MKIGLTKLTLNVIIILGYFFCIILIIGKILINIENKVNTMNKNFYTTHETGKFCNVYPTTVINWIKEGLLSAFTTPGGHRRIKREELLRLMEKNSMPIPDELAGVSKHKVLVIDDDPKILKMIKTILSAEDDLEVTAISSGFEAGFIIPTWMPDIILLDFLMPELDGFEVCRRIKSDKITRDIPVIAVTVLKEPEEIEKMFFVGISDYISKPFKSEKLVKIIKSNLPAIVY